MSCSCNNNNCGCKTSSDEVVYKGPNLTCTGIQNCDSLTTCIEKINNYMCSLELTQNIITNIINNQEIYNQFVTLVNESVSCEKVNSCLNP